MVAYLFISMCALLLPFLALFSFVVITLNVYFVCWGGVLGRGFFLRVFSWCSSRVLVVGACFRVFLICCWVIGLSGFAWCTLRVLGILAVCGFGLVVVSCCLFALLLRGCI